MATNESKEIELIDILNIFWKRKLFIVLPTFLCMIAALVIGLLIPPKWEIDAVIQPSKFLLQTEGGGFSEVIFVDPKQIVGQINQSTYDNLIASDLNLDLRDFPEQKAENLENTNLIRIFIWENDVDLAKKIINKLFEYLQKELDNKAHIEIKGMETQIKSAEIEMVKIEKESLTSQKKLKIIRKRISEIDKEMGETKKRIDVLERDQLTNLKKESRTESESLSMLLYSNEVQQSLRYYNTLNEMLSSKKMQEENINLEIEKKKEEINRIQNQIFILNEKKGRVDFTQFIKEPTSSMFPVFPKRMAAVLIVGFSAFILFTLLAFFIDYLEIKKNE
jgi:LPS O-antigen subunit length determinant protein (WzzB/FepE family)